MTKAQLRKTYLDKRKQLTADEYARLNQGLLHQFKTIDLAGINCIHIYLPIPGRHEPDTLLIIDWLKARHPHIKRVFPQTDFIHLSMTSFLDDEHLQLAKNQWGITEPSEGTTVDTKQIDMIIVPLLAVDSLGYRVGYGKGFYDRFMATCKTGTRCIGLSLFPPIAAIDDVDDYDIRLHQCITPGAVIDFQ